MSAWKLGGLAAVLIAGAIVWWQQSGTTPETGNAAQAGTGSPAGSRGGPGGAGGRSAPPSLVVVQPVTDAIINDRLQAVGSGKALASVSVVPLSSGLLTDVLVKSGQQVQRNDILALLDDEEQVIARDRAARLAENAAIDEARLAKLYRSRTTTEAELIRTRADLADAKLALREAELTLERRSIKAPIAGVVGLIPVDSGNYVTIIVEFWVPERFAGQIALGQEIRATAQANPSRIHAGVITGIGSRVESDSRTLPIQAQLNNQDDSLRPGMSFNLTLNFTGESFPAVDPLAVQWDSTGSYVWRLVEDKVERIPVQIIQRNPESVLVASELTAGDRVVTEGLLSLRPGAAVRLQGGPRTAPSGNEGKDKKPAIDGTAAVATP